MTRQTFGSALACPWALVIFGSNAPNGRRPATTVAFLTDDEGDHYLGGLVEHYRDTNEPSARWHYRYRHAKRIPKEEVLHIFNVASKSPWGGPSKQAISKAKKAIPITVASLNDRPARDEARA
jgi:hypothetical protein